MKYKDIPNYPQFEVSRDGDVVRKTVTTIRSNGRPIKKMRHSLRKTITKKGYVSVSIHIGKSTKRVAVHRLVAMTFIPNPKAMKEVNHKNGIKTDNRVENLEWCTRSENVRHSFKLGLRSHKGENNSNAKVTRQEVENIRSLAKSGVSPKSISVGYNISLTSIYNIISKRTWA